MFILVLLLFDILFLIAAVVFTFESIREQENRASRVGGTGVLALLILIPLIIWVPVFWMLVAFVFSIVVLFVLLCLIPGRANPRALKGSMGYVVGEAQRVDELDTVFARNRSLRPGSEAYQEYYKLHPEKEEADAKRRTKGGPLGNLGSIDSNYQPNVSMVKSAMSMAVHLGPYAKVAPPPDTSPADIDPEKSSRIVKNWAKHLGADLVGICRVNPLWAYSHRGEIHYDNWEDLGQEITDILPSAVVIATEMDYDVMGAGPHTPCIVESAVNYAKGAYITTILAKWISMMGYKAVANHHRYYEMLMVPLAVDAGLGELGRQGYLVSPKYGARMRVFAVLTDMPLVSDKPISLGVDEFCRRCKKCGESCPSRSIPLGDKVVDNGIERWKLDEESCFDYWGRVGTDCSICMGICPFSRPNNYLHNITRWFVRRSPVAKTVFPYLDNWIYGRKWRTKRVPAWLDYPKSRLKEKTNNEAKKVKDN